jgi:hypothetical protein
MKNNFMLKLPLLMLMLTVGSLLAHAQDSVKHTVVKPAAGHIPINPKTGRPYSRYGYGAYAKTYKAKLAADSIKKTNTATSPIKVPSTTIATTPPDIKADTPAAPVKVDKSLHGQYEYLQTKVYNYQKPFVDALYKNFMDTLKSSRNKLKDVLDKVADQAKTITDLQADVATKDQLLTKTDSISLLGVSLSKSTYNVVMWSLVLIIGVIAAVVITRTGGYKKEAVYRTSLYNELEEEFKTFKAKANEKEKKLARELQTERNKLDELTGRG